jgi:hypothetical protein
MAKRGRKPNAEKAKAAEENKVEEKMASRVRDIDNAVTLTAESLLSIINAIQDLSKKVDGNTYGTLDRIVESLNA